MVEEISPSISAPCGGGSGRRIEKDRDEYAPALGSLFKQRPVYQGKDLRPEARNGMRRQPAPDTVDVLRNPPDRHGSALVQRL